MRKRKWRTITSQNILSKNTTKNIKKKFLQLKIINPVVKVGMDIGYAGTGVGHHGTGK